MRRPDQPDLFAPPPPLPRAEALQALRSLVGRDLRALAEPYGVTVWRGGRLNKGWAGHVVERFLGRAPDSLQAPDFGDWELKVVPLVAGADGTWRLKETMGITMLTGAGLETTAFEGSHLWEKLARLVVVARVYEGPEEARSLVHRVAGFDLDDEALRAAIREDYEEIRWVVRMQGVEALDARPGRLVQCRPKGSGHGSEGLGFYARKALVAHILGLA